MGDVYDASYPEPFPLPDVDQIIDSQMFEFDKHFAVETRQHPTTRVPSFKVNDPFVTKDSGERQVFDSGMQRDTTTGKARPDLVRSGPMFQRWVQLLTRGAVKYDANNWMKAAGQEEYDRFLESAARHFEIWFYWRRYGINIENPDQPTREPLTEDHGAAVFFNINGVEYVASREDRV